MLSQKDKDYIFPHIQYIKDNLGKINNTIEKYISNHEYNISKDKCYKPKTKEEVEILLKDYNINKEFLQLIKKIFFGEYNKLQLISDNDNLFIFFLIYISMILDNKTYFYNFLVYLNIRFYGNLLHKNLRFCQDNIMQLTYKYLHGSHMYKNEGIYNTIKYNADNEMKRYYDKIKKNRNRKDLIKFIYEIRHRSSQQLKYFLDKYYKIDKDIQNKDSNLYKKLVKNDIQKFIKNFIPNIINTYFNYTITGLNNNIDSNMYKQINPNQKVIEDIINDLKVRLTNDDISKFIYQSFIPLIDEYMPTMSYLNKTKYEQYIRNEITTRKNGLSLKSLINNWFDEYINEQLKEKINGLSDVTQRRLKISVGIIIYDSIVDTIVYDRQLYNKYIELRDIIKQ